MQKRLVKRRLMPPTIERDEDQHHCKDADPLFMEVQVCSTLCRMQTRYQSDDGQSVH